MISAATFGSVVERRRRRNSLPRIVLLMLFATALMATGAMVLSGLPWEEARTHLVARSWQSTDATISSVRLTEESHVAADRAVQTELILSVTYTYEVDGRSYEGHRAALVDRSDLHDRDLRTLYGKLNFARMTGRTVPVVYDPHASALAYLDTNFDWSAVAVRSSLGVLALGWGLSLFAAMARRKGAASLL